MSWNGSGQFNRLFSWVADKTAGLDISSNRMDADSNDMASNGFGNCLTRDGQGSARANLPMNSFKFTGLGAGAARTDSIQLGQVQDGVVNWAAAGGTGDALTVTLSPAMTALVDGQLIYLRAAASNGSTAPTLGVNGLPAQTITKLGGAPLVGGDIAGAGHECVLRYNSSNTRFELLNPANSATIQPGNMIFNPAGGAQAGWVRANGRTIGSASSGAAERANADTIGLYLYLYNNFSNAICPVSGGRSGNATNDFAANKTITLLDYRGRAPFGVDDMGNSAAGRLTGATFGAGNATTAGSSGGEGAHTLTIGELASHSHGVNDPLHSHGVTQNAAQFNFNNALQGGGGFDDLLATQATVTINPSATGITIQDTGSGQAHNNMPPFALGTWYLKL